MRGFPRAWLLACGLVAAGAVGCGGGAAGVDNTAATQDQTTTAAPGMSGGNVQNHVHGAVPGQGPSDILLGTHFGLRLSRDGGATWTNVPGTGGGMVAAIVRVPAGYAAAVMPGAMTGSSMSSGGMATGSSGGMSMTGRARLMYSPDGQQWTASVGLPADGSISNLASAPTGAIDWASLTGKGLFRSTDAGRTWTMVVPTPALITALYDAGPTLIIGTPDGLGVTDAAHPAMPASTSLKGSVNAVARWWSCPTCLVATLASGGVATSRDDGATWQNLPAKQTFDNVSSFSSTGPVMNGMVAAPTDEDKGVWRSADGGRTWTQVLAQPQVDYMLEVPGAKPQLLAFQWGIVEWRSTDGGVSWSQLARL